MLFGFLLQQSLQAHGDGRVAGVGPVVVENIAPCVDAACPELLDREDARLCLLAPNGRPGIQVGGDEPPNLARLLQRRVRGLRCCAHGGCQGGPRCRRGAGGSAGRGSWRPAAARRVVHHVPAARLRLLRVHERARRGVLQEHRGSGHAVHARNQILEQAGRPACVKGLPRAAARGAQAHCRWGAVRSAAAAQPAIALPLERHVGVQGVLHVLVERLAPHQVQGRQVAPADVPVAVGGARHVRLDARVRVGGKELLRGGVQRAAEFRERIRPATVLLPRQLLLRHRPHIEARALEVEGQQAHEHPVLCLQGRPCLAGRDVVPHLGHGHVLLSLGHD
mmetsp:Transcript_366/g.829  ORF Transcript_366/g.829 Transcript_366/m.829 type:complete len:336 (-) Transcript_366:981-1988(-)